MRSGEMDRQITFRRRVTQTGNPGVPFGDFADLFTTRCSVRSAPAKEIAIAGQADSPVVLTVRIYDCARNRGIVASDRAAIMGQDYAISSVAPPDRISKSIELLLTEEPGP